MTGTRGRDSHDPSKRDFLHALTAAGVGGVVSPWAWRVPSPSTEAQGTGAVSLMYCWRRLGTMSREEAQRYWFDNHAPLVRTAAPAMNVRAYRQLHSLDDSTTARLRTARQSQEPFDGVAELSWNSYEEFAPAVLPPDRLAAGARLLEDERKFIDLSRSVIWLARSRVIVG
jgi:hypothetical protein